MHNEKRYTQKMGGIAKHINTGINLKSATQIHLLARNVHLTKGHGLRRLVMVPPTLGVTLMPDMM